METEKKPTDNKKEQQSELFMLMNDMEQKMNQNIHMQEASEAENTSIVPETSPATTSFPKLTTSYDDWISRLKENAKQCSVPTESPSLSESAAPSTLPMETQALVKPSQSKEIDLPFLDVDHTKSHDDVSMSKVEKSKLLSLSKKMLVLDPGSANRLYFEGVLDQFSQAFMVRSSAKRLQADVARYLQHIDLNAQDLSRAQLFQERLETLEEAGKALALCKKKRLILYITSYRLPPTLQKIQIIHVADLIKES